MGIKWKYSLSPKLGIAIVLGIILVCVIPTLTWLAGYHMGANDVERAMEDARRLVESQWACKGDPDDCRRGGPRSRGVFPVRVIGQSKPDWI